MTRAQAIAAKCRECIHDPLASGTWREQVATCHCTDCPLWRFRPLPSNAPQWIAERAPDNLPDGFASLDHDAAIRCMRQNVAVKVNGSAVQAIRGVQPERGAIGIAGTDPKRQNARAGGGNHGKAA